MRMALITVLMAVGCTAAVDSGPPVLERSTPEREGIPSAAIEVFVDAVAESGFEVHSFMMLRHGKVVTDGWVGLTIGRDRPGRGGDTAFDAEARIPGLLTEAEAFNDALDCSMSPWASRTCGSSPL